MHYHLASGAGPQRCLSSAFWRLWKENGVDTHTQIQTPVSYIGPTLSAKLCAGLQTVATLRTEYRAAGRPGDAGCSRSLRDRPHTHWRGYLHICSTLRHPGPYASEVEGPGRFQDYVVPIWRPTRLHHACAVLRPAEHVHRRLSVLIVRLQVAKPRGI